MGWSSDEPQVNKKGKEWSSKILLSIIVCVVIIIVLILMLLMNVQELSFEISVDGNIVTSATKEQLITTIDNIQYIDISQFSKLVGYEYHQGEYKSFTIEEDKCYVQGKNETATFFVNDDKVCKLPINDLTSEYNEFTVKNTIKKIKEQIYAPIEAISLAFNVSVEVNPNSLTIYTLDFLVDYYDAQIKEWGYTGITDQNFENKKSLLYGYFIVKKENGLYKIINEDNTKEIVLDKYTAIEFNENIKEFFVTNSLGQVGIINLDGTTKIEPTYESISVLDKEKDLYLIKKEEQFGVVKSGNITIIYPEYDSIGLDSTVNIIDNRYLILNTLIPVCRDNKWGAFDTKGNLVLELDYDGFGCNINTVEISGVKKAVEPLYTIEECKGIIVQQDKKYGMLDVNGKELVPIQVDSIYTVKEPAKDDEFNYFMLYNGKELNVMERLIAAGLIEDIKKENDNENEITNTVTNTISNNTIINTTVTNSIETNTEVSNQIENHLISNNILNSVSNNVSVE